MTPPLLQPRNILVTKFGGMGDYLCALPFLEDLHNLFSAAHLTIIASPAARELLTHRKLIDDFITPRRLHLQGLSSLFTLGSAHDLLDALRHIPRPLDLFVDLGTKNSWGAMAKPLLMKLLLRPRLSIGLEQLGRAFFHNIKVPERTDAHNMLRYHELLRALGGSPLFHLPLITPTAAMEAEADAFFGDTQGLRIGLHPGANPRFVATHAWPVARFAELADRLSDIRGCRLYASGSPEEAPILEALRAKATAAITPIPYNPSVLSLAAYLKRLDLFISNDTGPMHLAVAMGVPTVGIFGHANYAAYGSYPSPVPFEAVAFELNTPNIDLTAPRRLEDITVDMVADKAARLFRIIGK